MKKIIAASVGLFVCLVFIIFCAGWYGVYQIDSTLDKFEVEVAKLQNLLEGQDKLGHKDIEKTKVAVVVLQSKIRKCREASWDVKPACSQAVIKSTEELFTIFGEL